MIFVRLEGRSAKVYAKDMHALQHRFLLPSPAAHAIKMSRSRRCSSPLRWARLMMMSRFFSRCRAAVAFTLRHIRLARRSRIVDAEGERALSGIVGAVAAIRRQAGRLSSHWFRASRP